MGTPEGIQRFLTDLKKKCKENNIKLRFSRAKTVEVVKGIRCCGYCDGSEIAVGKGSPHWLATLVHESSHLDQFLENSPLWTGEEKFGNYILDSWLVGKDVKHLRKSINRIISLELDCEKRSIKKIAHYDLPINTITYIQKANAYLLYYKYVQETRRWKPESYDAPEVYLKMPSRFMHESWYKKKLPEKYALIFIAQGL